MKRLFVVSFSLFQRLLGWHLATNDNRTLLSFTQSSIMITWMVHRIAFRDYKSYTRICVVFVVCWNKLSVNSPAETQKRHKGASHSTALFVTGSRNGYPRNELLISRSSSTGFLLASVGRNHWRDCPMTSLPAVPKQRCCHFFRYKAGHFTEFVQSVYVPNSNTLDLVLVVGVGGGGRGILISVHLRPVKRTCIRLGSITKTEMSMRYPDFVETLLQLMHIWRNTSRRTTVLWPAVQRNEIWTWMDPVS
jgi:hypothetical protein